MPLRRFAVIGAALIGEDGVRDVTIAPRNDAAAVAIGGKSWPLDIRLRPWVFRPHIGLLTLRCLDVGTSRPSALAVVILSTVSYFTDNCTGRSAGFSLLRMRST